MLEADFWQDKALSKKIIKEKKLYEDLTNSHKESIKKLNDLDDLNSLAVQEDNHDIQNEIFESIKDLRLLVKKNESKIILIY